MVIVVLSSIQHLSSVSDPICLYQVFIDLHQASWDFAHFCFFASSSAWQSVSKQQYQIMCSLMYYETSKYLNLCFDFTYFRLFYYSILSLSPFRKPYLHARPGQRLVKFFTSDIFISSSFHDASFRLMVLVKPFSHELQHFFVTHFIFHLCSSVHIIHHCLHPRIQHHQHSRSHHLALHCDKLFLPHGSPVHDHYCNNYQAFLIPVCKSAS